MSDNPNNFASVAEVLAAYAGEDSKDAAAAEDYAWVCAPEIERALADMGLYDTLRKQMRLIETAKTKKTVDMAKAKLEAIAKMMTIIKASADIAASASADEDEEDEDGGVGDIRISLIRSGHEKEEKVS